MKKIITTTLEETKKIALDIAAKLTAGDIVLLSGELGAGKTVFTKGIAEYFGIKDEITSPTFTLMNIYPVENNEKIKELVHIDTYRLENEEQLKQIGAEDYLGAPNTICVIEWPEKISGILKEKQTIVIQINHQESGREIIVQ